MGFRRPANGLPVLIRRPWANFGMVLLGVLFLVQHSTQLLRRHQLKEVVEKINQFGPFVGVVMAYSEEEDALLSSGAFKPRSDLTWVDLSGRRFHVGTIWDVDVIYVMCGQRRVITPIIPYNAGLNAGVTVQILADVFDIRGIVHYGTAGSANDSLSFGDVSIPKLIAFTGSWTWMKFSDSKSGGLSFGMYNLPKGGENLLAMVEFKPEEFFSVNRSMEEVFWLEVDTAWFKIAAQLQGSKLQQCVNETYCLPKTPQVVIGLKGSTADTFVDNAAYRNFLFKKFGVSTVDEESAAVVMTAISNGMPAIVFRGISDLAGGDDNWSSTSLSSLAATNGVTVAIEFIRLLGKETSLSQEMKKRSML